MMELTLHQKKVLAALHALESRCGERWWRTHTIGRVVAAGGFHQSIQLRTLAAMRRAGMVLVQYETLSEEARAVIHCDCYCNRWGLTEAGRERAGAMKANFDKVPQCFWDDAINDCVNMAKATMKRINDPNFEDDDGYSYIKWSRRR